MNQKIIFCLLLCCFVNPVHARITRVEILSTGPDIDPNYTQIYGLAHGEIDPKHRRNRKIQDVKLAPTNARGRVEYSMDFTIIAPKTAGNGLLFYEVPNVGLPLSQIDDDGVFRFFGPIGTLARARGYTIVFSGWQQNLNFPTPNQLLGPTVTNNGKTIVGKVRTLYLPDFPVSLPGNSPQTLSLAGTTLVPQKAFIPTDLNQTGAVLTRRLSRNAPAEKIDRSRWAFADCRTEPFPGTPSNQDICLVDGFDTNYVYELVYEAKDPQLRGLGFAATRDLVSFLRQRHQDDHGNRNPVAGTIKKTMMFGVSLSSAYMRQFLHLGFNQAEDGTKVFDGMNPHAAPVRLALNTRFEAPQVVPTQRATHIPGAQFPFSLNASSYDPVTKQSGWIQKRCKLTQTCPKIVQTTTSTEYWQFFASLSTTHTLGRWDLRQARNVRTYMFSGTSHLTSLIPGLPQCQQLLNNNDYLANHKALIVALERWLLWEVPPPRSRVPKIRRGTLVAATQLNWPKIPGVTYKAVFNDLPLVDFGPRFRHADVSGLLREPPRFVSDSHLDGFGQVKHPSKKSYRVLVPQVDTDGNEIGGIKGVSIQAPIGTYAGWNMRSPGFGEGDLCTLHGSFIPFAQTRTERRALGDPRLSLEERYGTQEGYVKAVTRAARRLQRQRLLLQEDADQLIEQAKNTPIL